MTPEEFRAWLQRRGLTQQEAAALLGTNQSTISRWASGERRIPTAAVILGRLLERERAP